jgi:hypothetical protein
VALLAPDHRFLRGHDAFSHCCSSCLHRRRLLADLQDSPFLLPEPLLWPSSGHSTLAEALAAAAGYHLTLAWSLALPL